MKTFDLVEVADADKMVHVSIPVDEAARRYRLTVLVEPEEADGEDCPALDEWPSGFFERTAGKWVGEFIRAPQGDYEQRATL